MRYLTVQQVANIANMSKSGMWKRIRHTRNFNQYMSTDSKTNARLISPKGVHVLLSKSSSHSKRNIAIPSTVYYSMLATNQRQDDEIQRLTRLLSRQQKIAQNAQNQARQLRLNPPKQHGIWWKLFH